MIKDLPPPAEAEEYRWLFKRSSEKPAANSLIVLKTSIGWLPSPHQPEARVQTVRASLDERPEPAPVGAITAA